MGSISSESLFCSFHGDMPTGNALNKRVPVTPRVFTEVGCYGTADPSDEGAHRAHRGVRNLWDSLNLVRGRSYKFRA